MSQPYVQIYIHIQTFFNYVICSCINIIIMITKYEIILLFLSLSHYVASSYCPHQSSSGTVISGRIVAALETGSISLTKNNQIIVYNYILPYQFQVPPQVAISLYGFQLEPTKNLFFFIKTLKLDSISSFKFILRTHWQYTQWTQLQFNFIAEDRADIESGYYLVDSGSLSGAQIGKTVNAFLPFKNKFLKQTKINHCIFLNGFQITAIQLTNIGISAFQIQISSSIVNQTGIIAQLSVTTQTQVNSIYVSYIAYQHLSLYIIDGTHIYDRFFGNNNINHYPENPIRQNYARIFGITGFIINYSTQRISVQANWNGVGFVLNLKNYMEQNIQYFSYSYLFFMGSHCHSCIGYNISYNNQCINQCPEGTNLTKENICVNCGQNRIFNGTMCVTQCPKDSFNTQIGACNCPLPFNWDGYNCIPCLNGKTWNNQSKTCECQQNYVWNGNNCMKMGECQNGKIWDPFHYNCKCPQGTYQDGLLCKDKSNQFNFQ